MNDHPMQDHIPVADLSAFVDGELPDDVASRVAAHLATCADCATERDAIERTVSFVRAVPLRPMPRGASLRIPVDTPSMEPAQHGAGTSTLHVRDLGSWLSGLFRAPWPTLPTAALATLILAVGFGAGVGISRFPFSQGAADSTSAPMAHLSSQNASAPDSRGASSSAIEPGQGTDDRNEGAARAGAPAPAADALAMGNVDASDARVVDADAADQESDADDGAEADEEASYGIGDVASDADASDDDDSVSERDGADEMALREEIEEGETSEVLDSVSGSEVAGRTSAQQDAVAESDDVRPGEQAVPDVVAQSDAPADAAPAGETTGDREQESMSAPAAPNGGRDTRSTPSPWTLTALALFTLAALAAFDWWRRTRGS